MTTLSIAGLIIAYILIAILLLSLNLFSRWSWPVKAGSIIIVSCFYIISYFSFPPLLGWPTDDPNIPERFKLIAAHVQEPDKIAGTDGAIYLWLTDMTANRSSRAPRAYQLPFSSLLQKKVVAANAKLHKKLPQLGEVMEGDKPVAEVKDSTQGGQSTVNLEFFDMPDPLFPEK
jgi:hypothetical protein